MIRPTNFFIVTVLLISILALFQVKYKVQGLDRDLKEINRQIRSDKDSIHVLKAEWAYLNQPERLTHLAQKYLKLEKVQISQIVDQNVTQDSKQNYHPNLLATTVKWNYKTSEGTPRDKDMLSHVSMKR
jgi:cell division protein FtsL